MPNKTEVLARAELFRQKLEQLYTAELPEKATPSVSLDIGRKNIRVVTTTWQSSSCYCFIGIADGALLKSAGYNAPAKGARGNIFNENCDVGTVANLHGGGLYK